MNYLFVKYYFHEYISDKKMEKAESNTYFQEYNYINKYKYINCKIN